MTFLEEVTDVLTPHARMFGAILAFLCLVLVQVFAMFIFLPGCVFVFIRRGFRRVTQER